MDKTHETYVKDLLRDVWHRGAAVIPLHLLYRWYNADRLTKRIWTDLLLKWEEIEEEEDNDEGWRLGFINHERTDVLTLVTLDPEGSKESHLLPISTRIA